MTPRSIRRAAERKARKLARREEHSTAAPLAPTFDPRPPAPPKPAQPSAEPESVIEVPTLTGRTLLLPASEAAAYTRHLQQFLSAFRPNGVRELQLVQSLADTEWRIHRVVAIESALYAQARLAKPDENASAAAPAGPAALDLRTHLLYAQEIRAIQLQENRLRRRFDLDLKEFRRLQQERFDQANQSGQTPVSTVSASASSPSPVVPAGFEFSDGFVPSAPISDGFEFSNTAPPSRCDTVTTKVCIGG